jgi:hypothetical protein
VCVGEIHTEACKGKIQEMHTLLTAQRDDLKNQLEFQKNQTESLQKSFATLQQQSSSNSNYMKATLGGGGFLLGAVGVGRFVYIKMLNRLEVGLNGAEKNLNAASKLMNELNDRVIALRFENAKLHRDSLGASFTAQGIGHLSVSENLSFHPDLRPQTNAGARANNVQE